MINFSKEPSFKTTENSIMTEHVLPLMAYYDGCYHASGTCVIIGGNLAITAKHVIEDYLNKYSYKQIQKDHIEGNFHLLAGQIFGTKKEAALWFVPKMWLSNFTDVAFIYLSPATDNVKNYKFNRIAINLLPPPVGSRISGFGYPNSKVIIDPLQDIPNWINSPYTTVGEVMEIHEQRRDSSMLNFPCFRTNARFDGGMSGGPIFTDDGHICGLVCSAMESNENEENISYVASLWPSMGTLMDANRPGYSENLSYRAIELAKDGFIYALNWERVTLIDNEDGTMTVQLKI